MRAPAFLAFLALAGCGSPSPGSPAHGRGSPATVTSGAARNAPPSSPHADGDFLRRFALTRGFRLGAPRDMTPTPDGNAVLFLRSSAESPRQSLFETDLRTGATREVLAPDAVAKTPETLSAAERGRRERLRITTTGFTSFELTADGERALLSLSGRLFVLTRATGAVAELRTGAGAAVDPHFSPDGTRVAYARGNDLYVVSVLGGAEIAVTRGGTETRTHGVAEFVAQEELSRSRGFWWSPDGARIVYEEADIAHVDQLRILDPAHPERDPERTSYPRAGSPNADVRLGLVLLRSGQTTFIDWDRAKYPYLATVTWKGGPLTLYVMDRLQKNAQLLAVDPRTGKTRELLLEHDDAWITLDSTVPRWLPDASGFVWSSEKTGAWELAMHDADGQLVSVLAPSKVGYRGLLDVDVKSHSAVILASSEPTESRIVRLPFEGGAPAILAEVLRGVVTASFGEGHTIFATREATLTTLPRYVARSVDGKIERVLPSVAADPGFVPGVELVRAGGDETRVAIVRPRSFDPKRKYPIIDAAYGGPGVTVAPADAFVFLRAQWMADAVDAVVVSIDARGTPHRGRAWERAIAGKLGTIPLEGHVAALQALGPRYPEMDLDRVGIYGWSFGGYLSALAVLARPDVFKVAVAGAPPADWRDYDTCYTERYLGLPSTNAAAYDEASLLERAKGNGSAPHRPLLVVHGTADDNVYFAHSLKLADALERAGRPFELMPLAGVTHMLTEPQITEAAWLRASSVLRAALWPAR